MLLVNVQRRPSFPQGGSGGEWGRSKLNNGKPAPTAASMAEMQYDDDDTDPSPVSPTATPHLPLQHAPHCRCANNTLRVPDVNNDPQGGGGEGGRGGGGNSDSGGGVRNPTSQSARDTGSNDAAVCTCQLSYVTLGGVTSPDGWQTSLVTNNNKKKPRRPRGAKPTVLFNVGGQTFETYRSTLKKLKNSFFADDDKMRAYFRPSHGDYFFDRDPTAFGCVLNYLRTGDLHVPTTMCGPALQAELEFWGIEELDIERCCWTQYNTWKTQSRSLEKLEYDRKFSTTQNLDSMRQKNKSCWGKHRAAMWQFLQDPGSSRAAKGYAWVSIIFVFISIFSFCADTHPVFRIKPDEVGRFASVYRFFNLESADLRRGGRSWDSRSSSNSSFTTASSISFNDSVSDDWGLGNQSMRTGLNESSTLEEDLPHPSLLIMDMCCLIFFTLEYVTRFVCSPSKVNFLRSFQNVIDFVAISPDYVELLFLMVDPMRREGRGVMDLMFILRMLRLCRIFRLIRHVPGLWILLYTLKASFNELMLMFVFLLIGMVVFATLMHFAEGENGFANIPVGFWWSVVTMTTVGYGDMFPQTAAGYVIGSCCAVAGLLMIAFTVPIIVSNFVLYYTHVQYGLARRDRELERLEEEGQGHGDEENALDHDISGGSRSDVSECKARLPSTLTLTSEGMLAVPTPPPKVPVDAAAVALGEDVALTSPEASRETDRGGGGREQEEVERNTLRVVLI